MIYSRSGEPVAIIGHCGNLRGYGQTSPAPLVLVKLENGEERFHFVYRLRSDKGPSEVSEAVASAPKLNLDKRQQRDAIEQAS